MSLLAFAMVLVAVTTGWERNLKDEGIAAHLFQLLIVLQVPLILTFPATENWLRVGQTIRTLGLQVLAVGLAVGSVAFFKL
jgi:hypothetical protein